MDPWGQYSRKTRVIEKLGVQDVGAWGGVAGVATWLNVVVTVPVPRPQRRYATGEPSKVQGRDRVVIVEAYCGSVFEKKSLYRETCVTRRGGRHVAKRSCDPPPGPCGQYSGKNRFIQISGVQDEGL